jgi:hypothetical protein
MANDLKTEEKDCDEDANLYKKRTSYNNTWNDSIQFYMIDLGVCVYIYIHIYICMIVSYHSVYTYLYIYMNMAA